MKFSKNHPMVDIVHVDEFVLRGHEETKQGRSYEIAINNKFAQAIEKSSNTND